MARVRADRVSVHVFRQLPASEKVGRPSALPLRHEEDPARTQSHMLDWMVMTVGGSPDAPHWGAPESSYSFSLPLAASRPLTL